jgi:hypothetical protein
MLVFVFVIHAIAVSLSSIIHTNLSPYFEVRSYNKTENAQSVGEFKQFPVRSLHLGILNSPSYSELH